MCRERTDPAPRAVCGRLGRRESALAMQAASVAPPDSEADAFLARLSGLQA